MNAASTARDCRARPRGAWPGDLRKTFQQGGIIAQRFGRREDRAVLAQEQGLFERLFQSAHLVADGAGGQVQGPRGIGEAAMVDDGPKRDQQFQRRKAF